MADSGKRTQMQKQTFLTMAVLLLTTGAAAAGDMTITIEIPRLDVAEYHRPYVATWIEREDRSIAAHLALWYQTDPKKEDGTQWLKDLRQWWRRGGRALEVPVDGVTGATRPAGQHTLTFAAEERPLADLAAGEYTLVVEASREVGGRELLRIPFEWPGVGAQRGAARGEIELGELTLAISAE